MGQVETWEEQGAGPIEPVSTPQRVAGVRRHPAMDDAAAVRDLVKEMETLFRSAQERRNGGRVRAIRAGLILLNHRYEHGFVEACGITQKQAARCREFARAWQNAGAPACEDGAPSLPIAWDEIDEDRVRAIGRDPSRVKFAPSRGAFEPVSTAESVTSEIRPLAGHQEEGASIASDPVPGSDPAARSTGSTGRPHADAAEAEPTIDLILGDCKVALPQLRAGSANLIVTSPPYADRRDGGVSPDEYVEWFVARADAMRNLLAPDGTLIVNIKEHVVDGERHTYVLDLIKALRYQGWLWTEEWAWHKSNSTPGRWPNRFRDGWERLLQFNRQRDFCMYQDEVRRPIGEWATTRHRTVFAGDDERRASSTGSGFAARRDYWVGRDTVLPDNVLDPDAGPSLAERIVQRVPDDMLRQILRDIEREEGVSNVLRAPTVCRDTGHSAAFPIAIPDFFIRLFTRPGDVVLDPFCGSGTTGEAALALGRSFVGIDIDPKAIDTARTRIEAAASKGRAA